MILITDQIYQSIFTHAESTYPEECCGLLLGKITETAAEVISIQATENNSGYTYLIVSVVSGRAIDLQAWQLDEREQFQIQPQELKCF